MPSENLQFDNNSLNLDITFKAMTKQIIIERTMKAIIELPQDKAEEISDFADFVFKRYEENELINGIQNMASKSQAFDFLKNEDDIYSIADLKEVYNA